MVLVGGLLLQAEAHLGARHKPSHEVRLAPHKIVQAVLAPGEEPEAAIREVRQAPQVPIKVRAKVVMGHDRIVGGTARAAGGVV